MLVGLMIIIGVVVCIQMISNLNLHRLQSIYLQQALCTNFVVFSQDCGAGAAPY